MDKVNNELLIASIKDPKIVLARELTTRAGRLKHKKCVLFGLEQIEWALKAGTIIEYAIHAETFKVPEAMQQRIPFYKTTEGVLKKATETTYLIPLIAIAPIPTEAKHPHDDFIVVLDDVVDFGNIGTIIRTAQSFGIKEFATTSLEFDPFQRKVIDASRGSIFNSVVKKYETPEAMVAALKHAGYQIVVTSPYAQFLQSQAPLDRKPVALIVGNETHGVSDAIINSADVSLQIPMAPSIESLNVGVATGISVYELKFRMILLMLRENIFQTLGRQVNVTGKLIQMVFDTRIKKLTGLSAQQIILLMINECDQKMTREEIAKDVALWGDDLVSFLQPLFDRNYVAEAGHSIELTSEGKLFLAQIWPVVEQVNEEILHNFTPEERVQLQGFLDRIQQTCTHLLKEK